MDIVLQAPFLAKDQPLLNQLNCGDRVFLSGEIYTARDAAHKKMIECLDRGKKLPFDPFGAVLYYVGPSPTPPGCVIGSAGPTTASRMDAYTQPLLLLGVKGMIGKGYRSPAVRAAIVEHQAVYFAATGGAGVLLSKHITASEVIAWEDLGTEAVRRLTVERFPVTVAIDTRGGCIYEKGPEDWRKSVSA